ncbi:hypothetical protein Ntsu_23040 [Nocardia sp. IFM 10818]
MDLCELYGLDEDWTATIKRLAEQAPVKSWWHAYADLIPANVNLFVGLEAGAKVLTIFQPLIVPGLLQTADYAREMDRIYFSKETDEELNRRVALRMQRQNVILRQRQPAKAVVVLHESLLRTVVGSARVMAAQLRHIADLSTRDNVDIRVLPSRRGFPLGMPLTPFIMFEFGRDPKGKLAEPTLVFAESFVGAMYFERSTEVKLYRESFRTVQGATLDPRPSRDLLREIAREYDSERCPHSCQVVQIESQLRRPGLRRGRVPHGRGRCPGLQESDRSGAGLRSGGVVGVHRGRGGGAVRPPLNAERPRSHSLQGRSM